MDYRRNSGVVPLFVSTEKAWYFNSWDKYFLPKPFSKVILRYGETIKIDRVKDREIFERKRMRLEDIMLPALIV